MNCVKKRFMCNYDFCLFQRLEPLDVPTLTAEQLAEKQKIADEKREEVGKIVYLRDLVFSVKY